MMSKLKILSVLLTLSIFMFQINSVHAENWLLPKINEAISEKFDRDCDTIVRSIINIAREKVLANLEKVSIEQIYNREIIQISDNNVECEGVAMFSDGTKSYINYGAYVDRMGDVIIKFKTGY